MRILGRSLFAAALLGSVGIAIFLLMSQLPSFEARSPLTAAKDLDASIVYPLRGQTTEFVFSTPQEQTRILSSADVLPEGTFPSYAYTVEALDGGGRVLWKKDINLRSLRLFVRGPEGLLIPHAFTSADKSTIPSAGDETLIDFGQPVAAIRLREHWRGPHVGRILVRVQEHEPIANRQLKTAWQRLSVAEQEDLAAGSPLGPELLTIEERRQLLINRWKPVGPSGIPGRDYSQIMLYERPGEKIAAPELAD
ncbi:hypothetical protein G7A66_13020 [Altererythrobacter sp. SALINAS58]|uniref:hypothetical protein n=1 Tax=Alteripontixanthobacter muriae TaxID=2705546 RepID=UPI0015764CCA|nr:hypothetical protein [Alteripontixanthobacter muriae]NTZ43985.1 hypothetical protein [Alteripontixanthobacter muriae]